MSRTLVLVRHAKAAQGGPDFDRLLAPRGEKDAPHIGTWLTGQGLEIDLAVVSPAARTRRTWELASAGLTSQPAVEFDGRIYDDTLDDLLDVVRDTPEHISTLALVGHNPALQELALEIDGTPSTAAGRAVHDQLPTSGVVVIDVGGEWVAAGLGTGTITAFASPGIGVVDLARWRLRNLGLDAPGAGSGADVVRHLLAVQSQDHAPGLWSLGQRNGRSIAELAAGFDAGEFLRTHVLRPTWHFVTPADLRWLVELTRPRVEKLMIGMDRTHSVDAALIARSGTVLAAAITEHGPRTRSEARADLAAAGIEAEGVRLVHILMHAELNLVVCSGPMRGAQHTYAVVTDRAPGGRILDGDEALGELAARYVAARGPVSARDLATWTSFTAGQAQRAMEMAGDALDSFTHDGVTYYVRAGDEPPTERATTALLLQTYDELVAGYGPTRYVLHPSVAGADRAYRPLVVIGTRLVGHWRRTITAREVVVEIDPFAPLSRADERAVRAAADRFAAFLDRPLTLVFSTG